MLVVASTNYNKHFTHNLKMSNVAILCRPGNYKNWMRMNAFDTTCAMCSLHRLPRQVLLCWQPKYSTLDYINVLYC